VEYSLTQITKAVKGKRVGNPGEEITVTDLLIDSRKLITPEKCLFVALKSQRNDAHRYIPDLYAKGVRCFVVSSLPDDLSKFPEASFIQVKDTLAGLQMLATWHRKQFSCPVIGITGSNGKTIVKEWLYQLLAKNKQVVRSPKSFNSQIGVPLSVWKMKAFHDMAIFEAGISEPDEMGKLQQIIQPDIGVFTNIGQAHEENFLTLAQKVGEKLKLFTKVKSLIYCADHNEIQEVILRTKLLDNIQVFTWARKTNADLMVKNTSRSDHFTHIDAVFKNEPASIRIPFTDEASVENAITCWAVMLFLGYDQTFIAKGMETLQPVAMRMELKEGINNCSIINDSYNSDINSLSIAIDFLQQQRRHKKKTMILSDILQSGRNPAELYEDVAALLKNKSIDRIIGIGKDISKQADKFDLEKAFFPDTEEFLEKYPLHSFQNETILLKGARVFAFEKISRMLEQQAHETVLEINLDNLVHNLNYYRSRLHPGVKTMAMVKAFSYGSGSFEIASLLQFHRVDYLSVAYADEGIELRNAGITLPIMVMNPEESSFDSIIKYNLEPEIYSFRLLSLLEEALQKSGRNHQPVTIHIKLDTGMRRLGFDKEDMELLANRVREVGFFHVGSIFTHLAATDDPTHDDFTRFQIDLFNRMALMLTERLDYPVLLHALNSAGITRFPDAQYDMVRVGIGLYGIPSAGEEEEHLKPVSTLKSTISQIKQVKAGESIGYSRAGRASHDMTLAVIGIGYADGLNRRLSKGKGSLYIHGQPALIIGNICMDMCMVDITGIACNEGDEVIIFGPPQPISSLARMLETIPYEILTSISRRVKRIYFRE